MLSPASAATIRATLPAVGAAIGDITERFYDRLFTAHPELLRDLFNRGNQAAGTQREALAGAIAAFATALVEHPEQRPDAMLERIAHKHASLGVTPGQYEVVHTHLFAAIAEVLGDAVTDEVAAAWDDVYWLLANGLIAIEARLYARHGVLVGDTWRPWVVTERTQETADVVTFRLRPADGGRLPTARAGQYVSVRVPLQDGARQIRQYSLSGAPGKETRTITVKRDGEVSTHLHDHVHEGDRLEVSAPYGDLVLPDTRTPLLLASAGIGVTPMLAMLDHLAESEYAAPVTVVHGDRSPAAHALRTEQRALAGKLPDSAVHFWYENTDDAEHGDRTGLVDLTDIPLPDGLQAYLCGPLPFMRSVRTQLLDRGIPAAAIHYEVFGPDLWLAAT
ncbi:globin domain-containing protein [Streptomyces sp. NPDC050315]|uniref:globin domain-containing protein n=1 Tax=Streptomyces sp. NPDC050315 TaxID=3155039 RepID=UPI00343F8D97